jgi:hypothetical protein
MLVLPVSFFTSESKKCNSNKIDKIEAALLIREIHRLKEAFMKKKRKERRVMAIRIWQKHQRRIRGERDVVENPSRITMEFKKMNKASRSMLLVEFLCAVWVGLVLISNLDAETKGDFFILILIVMAMTFGMWLLHWYDLRLKINSHLATTQQCGA